MARPNLDPLLLAEMLKAAGFQPVVLAMITFRSQTQYAWNGDGPLVAMGQTFIGLRGWGGISDILERTDVNADGVTLSLSGIDPVDLAESLDDIQVGAPAKLWIGAVNAAMQLVGEPYQYFAGFVDRAPLKLDGHTATISLQLENSMVNHGRPNQRRYTAADQHANGYADDIGFNWVEEQNDIALVWGS